MRLGRGKQMLGTPRVSSREAADVSYKRMEIVGDGCSTRERETRVAR